MASAKRFRFHALVIVTVSAFFYASAGADGPEQQADQMSHIQNRATASSQEVDRVPLRIGLWEQTIFPGSQSGNGDVRQSLMCPDQYSFSPFPSFPSTVHLGGVILHEMILSDDVRRLADGRYRVTGGITTTLGGDVTYTHLITVHGDDHYDDVVTVTLHARTHPVRHIYSGNGHWVSPCPVRAK
jgi:hypothetical protein